MNSNDQTTQPTIATVLERINELGNELRAEMQGVKTVVSELRSEMEEFRFLIERRIDIVTIDMNKLRADNRIIIEWFDKLERRPA